MTCRLNLLLSGILLQSFCFLNAVGQPNTIYDFNTGTKNRSQLANVTGTASQQISLTSYLASGNGSTLNMVNKYSPASVSNPGPFCYLEVVPRAILSPNTSNISTTYWTKPCPRTPQQAPSAGFWCEFDFSSDGNLLLTSGGSSGTSFENGTVLWSSNTTGMGVQSMGLLDSDPEGLGNLVLYNANKEVVWRNIANNPSFEDYSCNSEAQAPVGAPTPQAGRKLLQHYNCT